MSYNADSVHTNVLDAWMRADDVLRLYARYQQDIPEINFLEDILEDARAVDGDSSVKLRSLMWSGEWSGHSFREVLIEKIAPHIMGKVEAIFFWERGDSVTGLLIEDGRVAECKVECRIIRPEGGGNRGQPV